MTSATTSTGQALSAWPKCFASILAAALFAAALFAPAARAEGEETVRSAGNVTYVSGGVGTDSMDQLRSLTRDFNLKLVFALNSGEFLSGVNVAIADKAGKSLLDVASDGPWLLARLPAGRYRVSATFGSNAVTRNVVLGANGLKTLVFRWASD